MSSSTSACARGSSSQRASTTRPSSISNESSREASVKAPPAVAPGTQVTGQRVRACEQVALGMVQAAREDLLRVVVGQPRATADQRTPDVRCTGPAVGADAQLDGHHPPHLAGAQAAGARRELERQHRLHRAGHVDAAGAPPRLVVESATGLHVAGDVGDVHPGANAVAVRLDADRVVEVPGRRRIDRDRLELEQVVASPVLLALLGRAAGLAQRRLRPARGEPALEQQCAQDVPDVIGRAQALDDPSAAAGVLDDDELARLDGQTGAAPERELLALVEERLRDEEAPPALDGARDEPRPALLVVHRGILRATDTAVTRRRVFTVTSGCTPRPCRLRPFGREVLGDGELHGAAPGHRHDGLDGGLAERARTDDRGPLVLAQSSGDDLGGAGGGAIDDDHERSTRKRGVLGLARSFRACARRSTRGSGPARGRHRPS